MPEVLAGWVSGAGRLKVDSAAVLLRQHLLIKQDGAPGGYGTHSAKATLLSWAAKAGVKRSLRKLLGYHADGRDQSMLEYSRDAVAEPMRELVRVLALVRSGAFRPDVTRSGRWTGTKPEELVEEVVSNATASESDTTQGDNENERDLEIEEADVASDLGRESKLVDEPPVEGITSNPKTRLQHRSGGALGTTACGHTFTFDGFTAHNDWISGWAKCRRKQCFP